MRQNGTEHLKKLAEPKDLLNMHAVGLGDRLYRHILG